MSLRIIEISMAGILIGGAPPRSIVTQTSKGTDIANQQNHLLSQFDINLHKGIESQFRATYQGDASPVYNCHGMTFASRRTGITDNSMIATILKDEYKEIRNPREVIIGDIAIYFDSDGDITHSAQVVSIQLDAGICDIKVLSKTRPYKEIVHGLHNVPQQFGIEKRFYRINHGTPSIV